MIFDGVSRKWLPEPDAHGYWVWDGYWETTVYKHSGAMDSTTNQGSHLAGTVNIWSRPNPSTRRDCDQTHPGVHSGRRTNRG